MKYLSLVFRILTLAILIALGVLWFMNKDELQNISDSYASAQETLNIPDAPLSDVLTKGMNELQQTRSELRASTAQASTLEQQLSTARDELTSTEDQLRASTQKLRSTQRDLENAQKDSEEAEESSQKLATEMDTIRKDLVRVNKEKFELSQQIETLEEEKQALARRVDQMESMSGGNQEVADSESTEDSPADEIARLEERLESAQNEIVRLRSNPTAMALSDFSKSGRRDLGSNELRIQSVNFDRGMVVISPSSDDELNGVTNLTIDRDGSKIAELRLRNVYPNYAVAEILPSSVFPSELQTGVIYTYTK